jgi:hypothetical protein
MTNQDGPPAGAGVATVQPSGSALPASDRGPRRGDDRVPRLNPVTVRLGVVHVHGKLPHVTYRGPHPPHKRHWAKVIIDFDPDPQTRQSVDTASLEELGDWLHDQLLYAEDVAACVAQAVADAVGVPVNVRVKQAEFNSVQLTPTDRRYPVDGQQQPAG